MASYPIRRPEPSRPRRPNVHRSDSGFTLSELVVTIAIVVLLVTLAAPAFATFIVSQRVSTAATDVYIALTTARSEAMKRAANVRLSPATGGWKDGWFVADPAISGRNVLSHGALSGATVSGPDTVVFQHSGRIDGTSPTFTITFASGSSTATKCVVTDLSGRAYVKSC